MSTTVQTQVVSEAREALSRAVRQTIQALIPTLLVIAAGGTRGLHLQSIAILAGLTALVSVLKSAANWKVSADAPLWARLSERAVTAAAGTAIGLITADGFVPRDAISWQQTLTAVVGSALLAVAMFYTNPPVAAGDVVPAEVQPVADPGTTYLGDDGEPSVFPRPRDGGYTELLVILGVVAVIGIALLLFGVSFE